MAIDLATKFQPHTDEQFKAESKKSLLTNQDYDWTGAHTIKVYKVSTSEMNDYNRKGEDNGNWSRYGAVAGLDATTEELTLGHYLDGDETPHELFDPVFYGNNRFVLHWVWGVDGSCSRLYFGCPRCHRRVRYLYARGTGYVCRHCLSANYESQQVRPRTVKDIQRRMLKIVEDELGYTWWRNDYRNCQIQDLEFIPKPRYMRWVKYERLVLEYRKLQDDYTRAFIRSAGAFLPPEMLAELAKYM